MELDVQYLKDMAFKVFHGKDGIVPLFERDSEKTKPDPVLKFNPLAESVCQHLDRLVLRLSLKRKRCRNGDSSTHEALGNEWLEKGNCPIAKSYRPVSGVLPLVASTLRPPPGIKLKCPSAVVAARDALSRTDPIKNLRPQPLPEKMLVIGMLGMAANVPLGIWREHTRKFSLSWFIAVHAAVPFIAMLRKSVLLPKTAMAFTIAASILGQVLGSRAERFRLMARAQMVPQVVTVETVAGHGSTNVDGLSKGQCSTDRAIWCPFSGKGARYQSSSSSPGVCF